MTTQRDTRSWAAIAALLAMAATGRLLLNLVRTAMAAHAGAGLGGLVAEPGIWLGLAQLVIVAAVSAVVVTTIADRGRGASLLKTLTPAIWAGGLFSGIAWAMLRDDPAHVVWPLMLAFVGIATPTILEQGLRWLERQEALSQGLAPERTIRAEISIGAPIQQVWEAWTTPEGLTGFFAPECLVDLAVGGAYEMYFDPEAPDGQRGSEGCCILALQAPRMLSFTWTAPPSVPNVRGQHTHVTVRLEDLAPDRTLVTLQHDGWGEGPDWDEAYRYFERTWPDVVLPRLRYRFVVAAVDWEHAPGGTESA